MTSHNIDARNRRQFRNELDRHVRLALGHELGGCTTRNRLAFSFYLLRDGKFLCDTSLNELGSGDSVDAQRAALAL